jgi:hypothetical protein
VAGQGAVLEDPVVKKVGGGHRTGDVVIRHDFFGLLDDFIAQLEGGPKRDQIVVVVVEPIDVALSKFLDVGDRIQAGPGFFAEGVPTPVGGSPKPEGKAMFFFGFKGTNDSAPSNVSAISCNRFNPNIQIRPVQQNNLGILVDKWSK